MYVDGREVYRQYMLLLLAPLRMSLRVLLSCQTKTLYNSIRQLLLTTKFIINDDLRIHESRAHDVYESNGKQGN